MTNDTSYQPAAFFTSIGSTLASTTSTSGSFYWNGISAYANAPIYTGSANYSSLGYSLVVSSRGVGPKDDEEEPIVNEEIKRFVDFFKDNSL